MHDQIERMVKSAESEHDPDRLVHGHRQSACRRGAEPHGDLFAALCAQMFGAKLDAVDRSICFDLRIDQGFAALARGFDRQLITALPHDGGCSFEYFDPLARRKPGVPIVEKLVCVGQCSLCSVPAGRFHRRDERLIERRMYLMIRGACPGSGNHQLEMLSHGGGLSS